MTIDEALNKMPCLMEACSHCLVRGCDKPIEKIDEAKIVAIDTMRKYQKLQADYENRLKADLVAMLTEIQLEIEEIKPLEPTDDEDWQYGCFHGLELMQDKCLKLIQQKINSLKEG